MNISQLLYNQTIDSKVLYFQRQRKSNKLLSSNAAAATIPSGGGRNRCDAEVSIVQLSPAHPTTQTSSNGPSLILRLFGRSTPIKCRFCKILIISSICTFTILIINQLRPMITRLPFYHNCNKFGIHLYHLLLRIAVLELFFLQYALRLAFII